MRPTLIDDHGLSNLTTRELLSVYVGILRVLRDRDEIRSSNNPVADYAETLAARALGLRLVRGSTTGHDATDSSGRRFEIKARRITAQNRSTQLSAIRGLDNGHFDLLLGVRFSEDFSVDRACSIPHPAVKRLSTYRSHVNGWVLHLRDSLWDEPDVEDVTEAIRFAQDLPPVSGSERSHRLS